MPLNEALAILFNFIVLKNEDIKCQKTGQPVKELDMKVRYYISSAQLSPKEMLEATRPHWSIESQLHWRLDVEMREDECPCFRNKCREQAGENMAAIRHMAFNALNSDTSFKAGIKRKQKRASRNTDYLSQVLSGLGLSYLSWSTFILWFSAKCDKFQGYEKLKSNAKVLGLAIMSSVV